MRSWTRIAEAADLLEVSLEGEVENAMLTMKRMRMRKEDMNLKAAGGVPSASNAPRHSDAAEFKRAVTLWVGLAEEGELLEVGGVEGKVESAILKL